MGHPHKHAWRELEPGEKYCPGCGRIHNKAHFSKNRSKKDGLMSHCKDCDRIKQMIYQNKNRRRLQPIKTRKNRAYRAANPGYNARSCRIYALRRKSRQLIEVMERHNL